MTNADRIRAMTDEELVKLVDSPLDFFSCDECERPGERSVDCCNDCCDWILKFLQKETEYKQA